MEKGELIWGSVITEGFLEEVRPWPDVEELLRIRRRKDIPGRRFNVGRGTEAKTVHLGAPERAVLTTGEGLFVQGRRETLLGFDTPMLFAGPTGRFSPPG